MPALLSEVDLVVYKLECHADSDSYNSKIYQGARFLALIVFSINTSSNEFCTASRYHGQTI